MLKSFKEIADKKYQIQQSLKIGKAIENLVIHSSNDFYECKIDYQFHIYDLKIRSSESDFVCNSEALRCELILDVVNKAISKMQEEIMKRTNEVITNPKRTKEVITSPKGL